MNLKQQAGAAAADGGQRAKALPKVANVLRFGAIGANLRAVAAGGEDGRAATGREAVGHAEKPITGSGQ